MAKHPGIRRDEGWFRFVAKRAQADEPDALVHPQSKLEIGATELLLRNSETVTLGDDGQFVSYRQVSDLERAQFGWTRKRELLTGYELPPARVGPTMPSQERVGAEEAPQPTGPPPGYQERVGPDNPYKGIVLPQPCFTLGEIMDLQVATNWGEMVTIGELLAQLEDFLDGEGSDV